MTPDEKLLHSRVSRMAQRAHCRVSKAKRIDPVNRGDYRLTDLAQNRILLGAEFETSLADIETYLKRKRIVAALPNDGGLNAVRQLAAKRGYTVRRPRVRLYVKLPDGYQLFRCGDLAAPVVVVEGRNPTIEELYIYLRTQPINVRHRESLAYVE